MKKESDKSGTVTALEVKADLVVASGANGDRKRHKIFT
jgi:hypothetical protein